MSTIPQHALDPLLVKLAMSSRQVSSSGLPERANRTLMIIDVVESVRLVEADEEGSVARWLELIRHIKTHVLPTYGGRLVKDLGDGALFEFKDVQLAVTAAFAIHHTVSRGNVGISPVQQILLRIGIEVGDVILDRDDVFGRSVVIAQRFTTLAGPGETVVSAQVRERLTPNLDADVEDLGECHLKHFSKPMRAYRVGPPGLRPAAGLFITNDFLLPSVAVVPFTARNADPERHILGEILAEEAIRGLSRSPELQVISRLSTTAVRDRDISVQEMGVHLNANYVLSGTYQVIGGRLALNAELAEAKSGRILWIKRYDGPTAVTEGEQEMIVQIVADVSSAVMARELQRVRTQPLPTLKNYTLLMAAVALMHRLSLRDFEEARHLLQTLLDRGRRQAIPQAWLGKWHVLRVHQGWSPDPKQDARSALQCTREALNADPQCSLALTVDGFVHTHLLKRFDVARERYDLAVDTNPSESLAWLLRGTMHAFMGEGDAAIEDTQRAIALSPLDPHRYFYDSLAGTAYLAAGHYDCALDLAKRSLRSNRMHTSTLRVMTIAQQRLGLSGEARKTARELLRLEPTLTISRYLQRSPAAAFHTGKDWASALREAGVPT